MGKIYGQLAVGSVQLREVQYRLQDIGPRSSEEVPGDLGDDRGTSSRLNPGTCTKMVIVHSLAHSLEELDLALLHSLQIAPRVPWAEAGRILGASAAALAARWGRLTGHGLACGVPELSHGV
jgi:hypothetical protein